MTGLESRKYFEDRRNKWLEMHHAIGRRPDEQDAELKSREVLLELDTPIHSDRRVKLVPHAAKKLAVRDPCPATPYHRIDAVTFHCCGEV
ncbi:MAG: hypothetical protein ACREM3_06730 [Candidatus Rokuibacteriota bacterium]